MGGTTSRFRLYSAWGLSAVEIVKLFAMLGLTFAMGFCGLGGLVFMTAPLPLPDDAQAFLARWHLPITTTFGLGPICWGVLAVYLAACAYNRPISLRGWTIETPPLALALMQVLVASGDLLFLSGAMYVLMPSQVTLSYWQFANVPLVAVGLGVASHVPGGLGVIEAVVLEMVKADKASLMGTLVAFRAIYYLLPLAVAICLLGGHELFAHQQKMRSAVDRLGRWAPQLAPRLLAFACFIAGVLLLFSRATPMAHTRLDWIGTFMPVRVLQAMLETSHFLGSIIGVILLLLARGLQRRIDSAYWLTIVMLSAGIVGSLLNGFDYEEAIFLAMMLIALIPCRREFYRKSSLIAERFSPQWTVAVLLVIVCAVALAVFAYKTHDYSNDLWWEFELHGNAPRTLRALTAAIVAIFVITVAHLLQAKHKPPGQPSADDISAAMAIARRWPRVYAQLVATGDKTILFDPDRTAYLMYAAEGRSWVVLGDPIGDDGAAEELAWEFRELCDEGGRWPVFYQVETNRLPLYIDLGLSILKLGEEARVSLADFGLEGRNRKSLRHTCTRLEEREGCSLEIVEPPVAEALLTELETISNDWLQRKNTREKGFSLGYFRREYIEQFPIAIVRQAGRIIAFANVLRAGDKEELSIDLMRFVEEAPSGTMDYLFAQLMLRGQAEGYRWFNLGMAPLSGVEAHPLAPTWNRVAEIVFRHGEHFYNFQGLRDYKDKFDPVWEPKFLASPGGFRLPVILTNVATLIAGGAKGLVAK
jgi:phosphatidylglycerol lysyltransferase